MKCKFHPAVDAVAQCANCTTPLCGICANFTEKATLCDGCVESAAADEFVSSQNRRSEEFEQLKIEQQAKADALEERFTKEQAKSAKQEKLYIFTILGSFIFISVRLYFSLGSASVLTAEEILAEELYRDQLESCMLVFWEIAELLQNGEVPDDNLSCAEAGAPNLVVRVGDDIIVTHPRPELLGYSEIIVSKNNPVPELIE